MIIEQIYTGCLAQGAYYIESDGEAVIIDPLRDVEPYIKKAAKDNARIRYIFETHFHADFVSGHLDLASRTGATIVYGPTAKPGFGAHVASDGEELKVGKLTFKILHTPGHTLESTCYLLLNEAGQQVALFTGDTLFIGDVGRPDLAQKVVATLTRDMLAGMLYDSLHQKILPLSDDVVLYPAHGAGSACGKNMSKETVDTLGHQKAVNYALQPMDKPTFIKKVTEGLMPPPAYFPQNVMMNMKGYESMDEIQRRGLTALTPEAFEALSQEAGTTTLDTRDPQLFATGFIPGSINIGINGSFAPWAGALLADITQPVVIVADAGREEEVINRLARIGCDHTIGYLSGGISAWKAAGKELDSIGTITASELATLVKNDPDVAIIDVRKESEYQSQHLIGAVNIPLDYINNYTGDLDRHKTRYVHCAGGYRSMIFISIMQARGYRNLVDVQGGFQEILKQPGVVVSEYACPSTML